jgi:hypothetical protein
LPSSAPQLTLTTCTPKFSASHRLIVRASLDQSALVRREVPVRWSPPLTPPTAPSLIAIMGAAVLAVLGGVITIVLWNRQRFASVLVGLGGLAALWLTYSLLARALPGGF